MGPRHHRSRSRLSVSPTDKQPQPVMNKSIFTPTDSITTQATTPSAHPLSTRTSSPFRNQGTAEQQHRARYSENTSAITKPHTKPQDGQNSPSIWTSFAEPPASASPRPHHSHAQNLSGQSPPPSPRTPPTFAPRSANSKRKLARETQQETAGPTSQPASKRQKLPPRTKHTLSTGSFGDSAEPPSPLFFSHSPQRPTLPPRFSSGEAAARMLSKARSEESHVKTVSLARGTVSSPGNGLETYASAPQGSRRSLERGLTPRSASPEINRNGSREGSGAINNVLNSIGILELLEQDERPTFIVDLGDRQNYGPGPLLLAFANMSLRSYEGVQALVSGTSTVDASLGVKTFLHFKSWLLSAAVNGESLNVCLPPFNFANMTWSCSTLRRRLRIISGAFNSPLPTTVPAMRISVPPMSSLPNALDQHPSPEPGDYFGRTAAPNNTTSGASTGSTADVMFTIEDHQLSPFVAESNAEARILVPRGLDLQPVTDLLPSGTAYVPPAATPDLVDTNTAGQENHLTNKAASDRTINVVPGDSASFDWTRLPISSSMPEHIQFARSVDWDSTSLGPIESWSSDLRQMCNLIMASPHPAAMYWGDDLVAIYNEAYIMLAGQKHPDLMGQRYDAVLGQKTYVSLIFRQLSNSVGGDLGRRKGCLCFRSYYWRSHDEGRRLPIYPTRQFPGRDLLFVEYHSNGWQRWQCYGPLQSSF